MDTQLLTSTWQDVETDWLVVGVYAETAPNGALAELDSKIDGAITSLIESGDFKGNPSQRTFAG